MGLYRYSYYLAFWSVFGITSILAIVDRFTTNIWPRNDFSYFSNSQNKTVKFGSDFTDGLKPGPWTVKTFDAFARISGRYCITSCNALFMTMMTTTHVLQSVFDNLIYIGTAFLRIFDIFNDILKKKI